MKNPFWRWVRLREGREIFRATTELTHADGTKVTVSVEGRNAIYVSTVMNGIKQKYGKKQDTEPAKKSVWAPFEDFLRKAKGL